MGHKIKNISANNEVMLLKLGRDVAPYKLYQTAHIFMFLWSLSICSCAGQNIQKMSEETTWKVGLAYVLDKIKYFALLSRKW